MKRYDIYFNNLIEYERINIDRITGKAKHSVLENIYGKEFNFYRKKHLEKKGDEIEICKNCPDWKYRSWNHNYWKLIDEANLKDQKSI